MIYWTLEVVYHVEKVNQFHITKLNEVFQEANNKKNKSDKITTSRRTIRKKKKMETKQNQFKSFAFAKV